MELFSINKEDFEILNCGDELTEFALNGINYTLKLSDLSEIMMSVYMYFDVQLFKGNKLLRSGEMQLAEKYYAPISPNKSFIYLPLRAGAELINLNTERKIESSINLFNGNIFNESSTKMIINGTKEFKIIDMVNMEEIYHRKEVENYNNDAFFYNDNLIWRIRGKDKIEELNLVTNERKLLPIASPFEKLGIESTKYQALIDKKNHCLKLPEGGMGYSGNLNNWNYVNVRGRIIFKTLIPASEIKYSKGYQREYCDVVYRYIEITNE